MYLQNEYTQNVTFLNSTPATLYTYIAHSLFYNTHQRIPNEPNGLPLTIFG